MNITIKHDLNNKFACQKNAEYCGSYNGQDIYVFKIIDIRIERVFHHAEYSEDYQVFVRGEHTCWMRLENFFLSDDESELQDFAEMRRRRELLENKTYVVIQEPLPY